MTLRVAIDGRVLTDHYPGIGRYVWNLVRALPAVADDLELTLLTGKETGPTGEDTSRRFSLTELETLGVKRLEVAESVRGVRQQVSVPRQLREIGAEVFHAPYYLTAYRVPCPLAVTVYDAIGVLDPSFLPSTLTRQSYRVAMQAALASADAVVTLSRSAKDDLVKHFDLDPKRAVITPAAADPIFAKPAEETVAEVRQRLELPPQFVLHVGTNKPHKNLVRLVEAWAATQVGDKAADPRDGWQLVLAGRHDERFPEARERAQELGLTDVRFLGEVAEADLPSLYNSAAVFVMPSLHEGFGLPVAEAMLCGTAVACSRTSSLPAVAGAAAAYFDPVDVGSITTTLVRLLKNGGYRQMLAERGSRQAGQFSWEKTARQTLKMYRRLAAS